MRPALRPVVLLVALSLPLAGCLTDREQPRDAGDDARGTAGEDPSSTTPDPSADTRTPTDGQEAAPTPTPAPEPSPFASVAGEYWCETYDDDPCVTDGAIVLTARGKWQFGRYNGGYTIEDGTVVWDGLGGPAAWGDASIVPGGLAFTYTRWFRPLEGAAEAAAGSYACADCTGKTPIILASDGTWSWGASGGSFVVFPDGRARFSGPSSGPPGWGLATLGDGTLTWRATTYWRS